MTLLQVKYITLLLTPNNECDIAHVVRERDTNFKVSDEMFLTRKLLWFNIKRILCFDYNVGKMQNKTIQNVLLRHKN